MMNLFRKYEILSFTKFVTWHIVYFRQAASDSFPPNKEYLQVISDP